MSDVLTLPVLLTEADAYEHYGHVLDAKELRHARQRQEIGYYRRGGKILYRADELAAFIEARLERSYIPCKSNSGLVATGFQELEAQPNGTHSAMTPELEKSAADRLRQAMSRKQRSGSQRSSSGKARLRLVIPDKSV